MSSVFSIKELYEGNADFREYVNRYCRHCKLTVEEALQHAIVHEVAKQYKEEEYKHEN